MRIISGEFRRRQLLSPPEGSTTRPIPDRVKESLFSLLRGHFEGAAVLDCFAGTGTIGLEALSRGADRVVMVEKDKRVARILQQNIDSLGEDAATRCEVVVGDALATPALSRCPRPANLIFFDPPYALAQRPGDEGWERVRRQFGRLVDLLADDGFAVLRTPWPFYHGGEPIVADDACHDHPSPHQPRAKGKGRVEHLKIRRGSAEPRPRRGGGRTDDDGGEVELVQDHRGRWIAPGARHADEFDDDHTRNSDTDTHIDAEFLADDKPVERTSRVEVSLTFDNARGPETHVYGNTAVHLYMRK